MWVLIWMLGMGAGAGAAHSSARDACMPRYPPAATMERMFDMSLRLGDELNALAPAIRVVVLGRGGQDLSRFGVRYSHLAFAVRGSDGDWFVIHELNRCATHYSGLYQEGLANFIGESVLRADVLVAVPRASLQPALAGMLLDHGGTARSLHEPRYSLIAYPFSPEYQNSNQWVLEVVAAVAMRESAPVGRPQVQAWLHERGYAPSVMHLKWRERTAARLFVKNAAVTDHPMTERWSGDYSVSTGDSVIEYLRRQGMLERVYAVERDNSSTGEKK
ncbi:DUF2145 domain-containing protein [Frateuria defendens]|uniref:DUF2145 domain-containing protein n=1 Tax=Frateuria defendens TaxID=2219559 RepID=UPI001F22AB69|nr:DUF2145 domain-containing protein [Frateuria defendens]